MGNEESDPMKLEQRKLELEIQALERSEWKKVSTYVSLLPAVLAILTIAYGFKSGYLSLESTRLESERSLLKLDIARSEVRRDTLRLINDSLNLAIRGLSGEKTLLLNEVEDLSSQLHSEHNKSESLAASRGLLKERLDRANNRAHELEVELSRSARSNVDRLLDWKGMTNGDLKLSQELIQTRLTSQLLTRDMQRALGLLPVVDRWNFVYPSERFQLNPDSMVVLGSVFGSSKGTITLGVGPAGPRVADSQLLWSKLTLSQESIVLWSENRIRLRPRGSEDTWLLAARFNDSGIGLIHPSNYRLSSPTTVWLQVTTSDGRQSDWVSEGTP